MSSARARGLSSFPKQAPPANGDWFVWLNETNQMNERDQMTRLACCSGRAEHRISGEPASFFNSLLVSDASKLFERN